MADYNCITNTDYFYAKIQNSIHTKNRLEKSRRLHCYSKCMFCVLVYNL